MVRLGLAALMALVVGCSHSSTPPGPVVAAVAPASGSPIAAAVPLLDAPRSGHPMKKLAASPGHTCGLLVLGEVACWGGGIGPLDNGYHTNIRRPRVVPGIQGAIDVATGLYHSCAVLSNGTVAC